jgi:tricorn protease
VVLSINGQRLSRTFSPEAALVSQAGCMVTLTLAGEDSPRQVTVKTLTDEMPVRYREWVGANRRLVHEATHGKIGYLHIPDMEVIGYGEFHRGFLEEIDRDGLIVDVRYNTGGFVSNLIWEKLSRKRIGYVVTRNASEIDSYPPFTIPGPMAALANEFTGSDGDLFSQGFKAMGLGPLIGKRTWGGIIGISPRNPLVDGTITSQPENAYGFYDKGWSIENHGVDPDIEVENLPQDYAKGFDRQLDRAMQEIIKMLDLQPPRKPEPSPPPDRSLPGHI